MARLLVILPYTHLRMVAFDRRHIPQRILVTTQCYFLDEDKAFSIPACQLDIHWDSHLGSALLGRRDLRQLCLLSWFE
jgi:hypothetical protein